MTDTGHAHAGVASFFRPAPRTGGYRFAMYHGPHGGPGPAHARGAMLFVHAFGDEMNKSRRMVAAAARRLAAEGLAVLVPDLHGCGDSSGEFADATWAAWLDDVQQALAWLRERHPEAPLVLWGHRAGCLLALGAARALMASTGAPAIEPALLLWQPPLSGRALLQQFMRLRAAAGLSAEGNAGGMAAEAMRTMRADWAAGRAVHIAGYAVAPALAEGLEAAALEPPPTPLRIAWLETSLREPAALLPVSQATSDKWAAAGHEVHALAVPGPAFWQTQEIEDAPALVEATVQAARRLIRPRGSDSAAFDETVAPAVTDLRTQGNPRPAALPASGPVPIEPELLEEPCWIGCDDEHLSAIVSRPAAGEPETGVLIIVGGPQYRVGSHRQFVQLARALAREGHAVMRFDVRGMGDASGALVDFESSRADIAAAHAAFAATLPQGKPIVLWGLCDGASAALLHLGALQREAAGPASGHAGGPVAGLVLANPWVRSVQSLAATHVKHYYAQRLMQREFWSKLFSGRVGWAAVRELLHKLHLVGAAGAARAVHAAGFQQRMAQGYADFPGPTLLLISEADLTAREFLEYKDSDTAWRAAWVGRPPEQALLAGADHTFSQPEWQHEAERATLAWLRRLTGAAA